MSIDSASAPSPGASRSVVVVEDDADAREALVAVLELEGFAVEAAADGAAGVEMIRAKKPDAALIDIGLPGLDGYEVAKRIRALPGRRLFLVALTGYGQPEDLRRAREAGFDAHVVKPVDPIELAELLTREIPDPGSRG